MNCFHPSLSLLPLLFRSLHYRSLSLTHPPLGLELDLLLGLDRTLLSLTHPPLGLELDHSSPHHLVDHGSLLLLQPCFGYLHCNCQLSQSQHQIGFLPGVLCSYQRPAAHPLLPQTSRLRLQRAHLPFGRLHQGLRFQLLFFQWQPPPWLYLQPFCLSFWQQIWFLLCLEGMCFLQAHDLPRQQAVVFSSMWLLSCLLCPGLPLLPFLSPLLLHLLVAFSRVNVAPHDHWHLLLFPCHVPLYAALLCLQLLACVLLVLLDVPLLCLQHLTCRMH